jgi:hypothetical protein
MKNVILASTAFVAIAFVATAHEPTTTVAEPIITDHVASVVVPDDAEIDFARDMPNVVQPEIEIIESDETVDTSEPDVPTLKPIETFIDEEGFECTDDGVTVECVQPEYIPDYAEWLGVDAAFERCDILFHGETNEYNDCAYMIDLVFDNNLFDMTE